MPDDAYVHPTAIIEPHVSLGPGTRVWALTQLRAGASVGDDCNIGMGVFVDVDVRIGHRCKIQNHALVFLGSEVGDEVFIGPGACLTNDRNPRAATPDGELKGLADWTVSGVTLERGCSVGAHAVIIGGVRVGEHAMIGAGAVVNRDVPAHGLVVGTPARRIGWVCRCGQRLDAELRCAECGRQHRRSGDAVCESRQEERA